MDSRCYTMFHRRRNPILLLRPTIITSDPQKSSLGWLGRKCRDCSDICNNNIFQCPGVRSSVRHVSYARACASPRKEEAGSENTLSRTSRKRCMTTSKDRVLASISQLCTSLSRLSASFKCQIREVTPVSTINVG